MSTGKNYLFEQMPPLRALAIMALPTCASQMIILIYNLADTWFIGRTNNPAMVGASSIALTVYLAVTALANVFGVGGGSLMARLAGERKTDDARKVASYSVAMAFICSLVFSLLVLAFLEPLLTLLGAEGDTLHYAKQYVTMTTVIGSVPTVMSMCMSQLLRNAGYSRDAGIGVGIGSLVNIALDPLFMFVILPEGREVLGAGIATMLSNVVSMGYFIIIFRQIRDRSVLAIPKKVEKLCPDYLKSLYLVGVPAAVAIFLFDLVTIVINRLTVDYGVIPLAAMGIVLKVERIPINIGLGVCLGMVPLIAYNYGSGNKQRMREFFALSRNTIIIFSCVCAAAFWLFADPIMSAFISDEATISYGVQFLRGRCLSLPFMMAGYLITNYMNAVNKGLVSFALALIRHVVLIIPIMLLMNALWHLPGLVWSQLTADVLNTVAAVAFYLHISRRINKAT